MPGKVTNMIAVSAFLALSFATTAAAQALPSPQWVAGGNLARSGAGHWFEWREDGGFGITIGFGNAQWQRTGNCPTTGVLPVVPLQYDADGTLVENPSGRFEKQP